MDLEKFLVFKDVTVYTPFHRPILSNISFEVDRSGLLQINGLSGEGKSSLVKALLGIYEYTGSILFKGKDLSEYSEEDKEGIFSYLPQRIENIPNLSVYDFLLLGIKDENINYDIINKLNIGCLLYTNLSSLSIGQFQSCILAKSLMTDKDIIILDEPALSMDKQIKYNIVNFIKDLVNNNKLIILISHEDLGYVPDKVITLSNTKVYTEHVIVKSRLVKSKENINRVSIKIPIFLTLLLSLSSFFILPTDQVFLRVVWGIVAGGVLSCVGNVFYSIFKSNNAVYSYTSITLGNFFGIVLSWFAGYYSLLGNVSFSLLGGILPISIILLCVFYENKYKTLSKNSFSLFILISTFILLSLLTVLLSSTDGQYSLYFFMWNLGVLDINDYGSLFLLPLIFLCLVPIYARSDNLTYLSIDRELAKVYGINNRFLYFIILILLFLSLSLIVSQVGAFLFVGIVVPLFIRDVYGDSLRKILPYTFFIGSSVVLFSDIITRALNTVIPDITTGVTLSIISVSVLLFKKMFRWR